MITITSYCTSGFDNNSCSFAFLMKEQGCSFHACSNDITRFSHLIVSSVNCKQTSSYAVCNYLICKLFEPGQTNCTRLIWTILTAVDFNLQIRTRVVYSNVLLLLQLIYCTFFNQLSIYFTILYKLSNVWNGTWNSFLKFLAELLLNSFLCSVPTSNLFKFWMRFEVVG